MPVIFFSTLLWNKSCPKEYILKNIDIKMMYNYYNERAPRSITKIKKSYIKPQKPPRYLVRWSVHDRYLEIRGNNYLLFCFVLFSLQNLNTLFPNFTVWICPGENFFYLSSLRFTATLECMDWQLLSRLASPQPSSPQILPLQFRFLYCTDHMILDLLIELFQLPHSLWHFLSLWF